MQPEQAKVVNVDQQPSGVHLPGPGLKLPTGRQPDTAAELDGSDVTDTLLGIGTPRKRGYGRGHPKYPPYDDSNDYLPETCQGAGCLAAHYLALFAEMCSRDRGCREIFGLERQGQEAQVGQINHQATS